MDIDELKRLLSQPEHEDLFFEMVMDALFCICLIGIVVFCISTLN